MRPPEFFLGLDLAQANDWTALAVLEHRPHPHQPDAGYDLIDLQRWRGESYATVPERVRRVEAALRRRWQQLVWEAHPNAVAYPEDAAVSLVVDATGVGAPVVDMLAAAGLDGLVPIVIHGGDAVNRIDGGGWRVPKRDLVGTLQVLLQQRRLRIAEALPEAATLARELAAFRVRITASGHDTYGAGVGDLEWREQPHDDAVLAVALAAWFAEQRPGVVGPLDPAIVAAFDGLP